MLQCLHRAVYHVEGFLLDDDDDGDNGGGGRGVNDGGRKRVV